MFLVTKTLMCVQNIEHIALPDICQSQHHIHWYRTGAEWAWGSFLTLWRHTIHNRVQKWILSLRPSVESFKSRCCLSSSKESREGDKFHRSPGLLMTAVVKIDGKSGQIWQSTLVACSLIWITVALRLCQSWGGRGLSFKSLSLKPWSNVQ